jgi:hypothetical protein
MKGIIFANAKLKEVGVKMKRMDMTGLIEMLRNTQRSTGRLERRRRVESLTNLLN